MRYHHNAAGLVHKVTGFYGANNERESFVIAKNISINLELSRLDALTFGNGLKTAFTYDDTNRLAKQVTRQNGQVSDRAVYKREGDGIITAINRLDDTQNQKFTYDGLNRLTKERRGGDVVGRYGYDAAGNRTTYSDETATKSYRYAPDANRLTEINRQTLSYDARGNLLSDRHGKRGFGYDVTNRLSTYAKDGALKTSYSYNASGQRVEKTLHGIGADADGTRTTNFAYTPDGWLLSEIGRKASSNGDGGARTFTDEYIWLAGRPLAKLSRKIKANGETAKADILYIHTDHLATPRRATNANGTTVWSWESDAFGASKADRDPDGDGVKTKLRLRFPGQYYDDESGLHYNHNRDYDPKLGRYIQSDPIGLWGGGNRYGYVGGNPLNLVDPEGLAYREICYGVNHGYSSSRAARGTENSYFGWGTRHERSSIQCSQQWAPDPTPSYPQYAGPTGGTSPNPSGLSCGSIKLQLLARNLQIRLFKAALQRAGINPDNGTFLFQGNFDLFLGSRSRGFGFGFDYGYYIAGNNSNYGSFTTTSVGAGRDVDIGYSILFVESTNIAGLGGSLEGGVGPIDVYTPTPVSQGRPAVYGFGLSFPPARGYNASQIQGTAPKSCGSF